MLQCNDNTFFISSDREFFILLNLNPIVIFGDEHYSV